MITDTLHDTVYYYTGNTLDQGWYNARIRKACRYTTSTYDTLIWSPWSIVQSYFINSDTEGMDEACTENFKIVLSPNPASGLVRVKSDIELQRIDIYNPLGLSVHSEYPCGQSTEVTLKRLPSGTYIVVITTPKGTIHKKLIVK